MPQPDKITVERAATGAVTLRKEVSERSVRVGLRVTVALCTLLCLGPVIGWLLFRRHFDGEMVAGFSAVLTIPLAYRFFRQFSAGSRSYRLRADRSGLTIDTTTWRGHSTRHYPRNQIADIVLDFGNGHDPQRALFSSMLVIKAPPDRDFRCLHGVSGDKLARIADALRECGGLPVRSWP